MMITENVVEDYGFTRSTAGSGERLGNEIMRDSFEIRGKGGYLAQEPRYHEHMTAREVFSQTLALIRWRDLVGFFSSVEVSELEKIYHAPPSQMYVHSSPSFRIMADHRVRNFSR